MNGNHKEDYHERLERQATNPQRLEKQRLAVEIFGDSDDEEPSYAIKAGE